MAFKITSALKSSLTGNFEISRLIGGIGGLVYVIGTHAFVAWEVIHLGKPFDLTTYCLAFPTGLAAIGGGTAASVALKDRNVASANVIQQTGVVPVKGPQVTGDLDSEEGEVPTRPAPPANHEVDLGP